MVKVLITERFSLNALQRLKGQPGLDVQVVSSVQELHKLDLSAYEILVIRSKTKITSKFLQSAKSLKFVVTSTSGFDHIDLEASAANGVKVCYTPDANAQSAAELTWALLLACVRKINKAQQAVKSGNWNREVLIGKELAGKTLGIIGLGRVGKRVARIARAFDMNILAHDPYINEEDFKAANAQRCGWEEVLRGCDVLTLHVPLTRETRHFINAPTLECVNDGVILINTSRGQVVNEQEVMRELREGRVWAMGLDVFESEPLPKDSALLELDNVILTPHIGATTDEAFERASQAAVDKVIAFREGKKVCDLLTHN